MKANFKKAVWATNKTRLKTVSGLVGVGGQIIRRPITVRVTKDNLGESMSLGDDENGLMIHIPLEAVRDMLRTVGDNEE